MNDKTMTMSDAELDSRLRTLVATAVADAPPAPVLASPTDAVVQPLVRRSGRRSGRPPSSRGMVWAGIGVAAAAAVAAVMVWSGTGGDPGNRLVAGDSSTTVSAPVAVRWPADLAVIVVDDGVVQRVSAVNGELDIRGLYIPVFGDLVFELPSGSTVSQNGLLDVGLNGDRLVRDGDTVVLDAAGVTSVIGTSIERLTHGLDIVVGQTASPGGGWSPFLMTLGDSVVQSEYWAEFGVAGPHDPSGDPPRLFSVSPSGSTIGWVHGTRLVLANGRSFDIPDGSKVIDVDLTDSFVALTRAEGPGTIIDLGTGSTFAVPVAGHLTISLAPVQPSPTVETTVPATPETTVAETTVPPVILDIPFETDVDLTAVLQGTSFGSIDETFAAVEAQILEIRYAAVDPVEPIRFTRGQLEDGSLYVSAPNFDDSVPETWYRIVERGSDERSTLVIERIESVHVCRDGTFSTPETLCV